MKQYTTPEQTAKLVELGFEKPKSILLYAQSIDCDNNYGWKGEAKHNGNYSIGELIEMLPDYINGNFVNWKIQTTRGDVKWSVGWDCFETEQFQWVRATELIDALYDMIVKLKNENKL